MCCQRRTPRPGDAATREARRRREPHARVTLLRHGEPDWTPAGASVPDPGLTPYGHAQARAAAARIAAAGVDAIYVSPYRRAQETAEPLARATGIAPVTLPGLAEIGVNVDGLSQEDVDRYFTEASQRPLSRALERLARRRVVSRLPRARHRGARRICSRATACARAATRARLHAVGSRGPPAQIAVVAHGGTNAVALAHLLDVRPVPWEWLRFESELAAYSVVHARPLGPRGTRVVAAELQRDRSAGRGGAAGALVAATRPRAMKIGLVGYPGSGKSTVFGALTGLDVATGFGAGKANLGAVKVPDARVDALAALYEPKKTTYAEITFSDLGAGKGEGLDRAALDAMRNVDALCQVLRAFPDAAGEPGDPLAELARPRDRDAARRPRARRAARGEAHQGPQQPARARAARARAEALESERAVRSLELSEEEAKSLAGYALLTAKPLLLVLNVAEGDVAAPAPDALARAAAERGLGLVVLSARVEMDIAQLDASEQGEFLASIGLAEPAVHRFIRAAFALIDLISMLTAGPDECRAWPVPRGTLAPRAAGKIHSDIERGFIRAEVIRCEDLLKYGSEAKCKEAGALRIEGKEYVIQDGDVVHFRFNV